MLYREKLRYGTKDEILIKLKWTLKLDIQRKLINLSILLKKKIKLITNNDLDYLDMLYREKLRYGTKDEILIKLKWTIN